MTKVLLWIISLVAFSTNVLSAQYTRELNPTAFTTAISMSDFLEEFNKIERIINDLESDNMKDNSILNADFYDDTIATDKIKDGTLTAADFANISSIAAGSLIYATATSTLGELVVGSDSEVLELSSGFPSWQTAASIPWTDSGGVVYATSADDNVAIGGSSVGTSGKAVLALYNGTIPSSSPANSVQLYAQDVGDTETVLLLHLEGSDGAQTTTDSSASAHTVTFAGTAQIDTAQYKFGSSSLLLDGNSDYLSIADSDNWYFNADMTLEMFIRSNTLPADGNTQVLFSQRADASNYWFVEILRIGSTYYLKINIYASGSAVVEQFGTITISTGTWYHVALCRETNTWSGFFNGTRSFSATDTDGFANLAAPLIIGQLNSNYYWNGWMDEIRISKGTARYSGATYTVPSAAFSVATSSELKVRDEAGNITTLSPHNFELIPSSNITPYSWSYYSRNPYIGKVINVDMYNFVRAVEQLTGKQFIYVNDID